MYILKYSGVCQWSPCSGSGLSARHGAASLMIQTSHSSISIMESGRTGSLFELTTVSSTQIDTLAGHGLPGFHNFPVPSCNGLILISSEQNDLVWVVWNPFTGESLELPVRDHLVSKMYQVPTCSGIGYDAAKDDYKVVRIGRPYTYVYSVNSRDWHRIEDFPNVLIGHGCGVFAYGALHWVTYSLERSGDSYSFDRSEVVGWVTVLDLTRETYHKFPLPSEISGIMTLRLDGLNGFLFLSCLSLGGYFVVWMVKDYGRRNTWLKVISLKQMEPFQSLCLLAYSKSKRQVLLRCNGEQFLWYDVERKHTQRVCIKGITDVYRKDLIVSFSSFVYPASLVRLRRNDVARGSIVSKGKPKTEDISDRNLELKVIISRVQASPSDW